MNRQEFETWKAGIYESINEADSIIGLSQLNKGGVGSHNNRTPAEIKKVNDRRDDLKQKVADKMQKAGEVVGKSVKAGVDAVKNTAHDAGKVVAGAKKVLANSAKKVGNALSPKDDTPVGLAGLKRKAEEAKNKNNGGTFKSDDKPIGLAGLNKKTADDSKKPNAPQKKPDPVNSLKNAPTGKSNSKQQGKSQSTTTGKATTDSKVDDNKDTDTKDNGDRKGIAQKLKDGAKKMAHGAFNAYYGAKYTAQDAKDWLKKAAKHAQVNQAHKRGHDRAHYEKDEDNTKSKSSGNTTNNSNASNDNTKTTKSNSTSKSGNGSNIHIYINNGKGSSKGGDDLESKVSKAKASYDSNIHQARNDEDKKRREDEENKMKEERDNFFKKVNGQKTTSSAKSVDKEDDDNKPTSNAVKDVAKEAEKAVNKPKTAKKVGTDEPKAEKVEGDLKNKVESAKVKPEETKAKEKKERQTKVKSEVSPKAKEVKPEEPKAEEKKEAPKAEVNELKKADLNDKVKSAKEKTETKVEDKKEEPKSEEKKETPKIKLNPNASNYRKLSDDEVQKAEAKQLEPGEAKGSNTLQHVKTKGDEESMYDDDKGNKVPAKPSDVKKDDSGERTEKKAFLVKKAKEQKEETKSDKKEEPKSEEKKEDNKEDTQKVVKFFKDKQKKDEKEAEDRKKQLKAEYKAMSPEERENKRKEEEDYRNVTNDIKKLQSESPKTEKKEQKAEEVKETPKADIKDKVKSAKEKPQQVKKELTPEEKEAKAKRLQEIKAKQAQASQEAFKKRQAEMAGMKAGHEKSDEEIKANNEKVRKENGTVDPDKEVKKQENTVSSSWRESFIKRTHKDDYKDLPDEVSGHMKKYKDYWKRVNQKDHSMTDDERREGDELENKLKELVGKHPDAFGKKTTVKDKKDDEVKTNKPKKIDLGSKLKKAKEDEKSSVDKFIENTTGDFDGPSDAELKAIERAEKHAKRKK